MANVFDFGNIVKDHNQFTVWLKNNALIKSSILCPECVSEMKEVSGKRLWRCSKRTAHPSGKVVKELQLKGTLFEGARASPELIMELCQCFALKLTYDETARQTGAGRATIAKWFCTFREICLDKIRADTELQNHKLGGVGETVEVDKTKVNKAMA